MCREERRGSTSTSDLNGTDSTVAEIVYETGIHIYVWCFIFEWRQNNLVPNVREYLTQN